ncbi:hypothetical protein M9Y90_11730 [Leptospira interrogans]|uniref:Uncharacterized protein n=1 Tax=Leptospira interrogans serovar Bataviae TaxID=312175 RepID=A0AAP9WQ90_LEPIR|nr:hypothetical protein [Leptospira interrogans]KAA1292980.1 hypothetical protein C4X99_03745 [Leptospira interrogans serovar Geyaweera]MCL8311333.1 hypothetical protein [Leptospira interrogans]MCR8639015.1 hypothetical protein [Leptospira interrogans serovar Ricardi]QOI53174.1 hypothetical protein Lepto1489_22670 [Leptospira interrogans serovar Bataviae]
MSNSSSILPIQAAELIGNRDGKVFSLPLLAYKIQEDVDQLTYIEALSYGIIGKGKNMDEATEDFIETMKLYIQKLASTSKIISLTPSDPEKINIFKELYLKDKLSNLKSTSSLSNIDTLKKLDPTNLQLAI